MVRRKTATRILEVSAGLIATAWTAVAISSSCDSATSCSQKNDPYLFPVTTASQQNVPLPASGSSTATKPVVSAPVSCPQPATSACPQQVIIRKEATLENFLYQEESYFIVYVKSSEYESKVYVPASSYFKYKSKSHRPTTLEEYPPYVTYSDPTVKEISKVLIKNKRTKEESARAILKFVHEHIMSDGKPEEITNLEYVKFPVETLVERNGDCEDTAILAAALMKAAGIDVVLLYLPKHMSLGVHGDFQGTYYTLEKKKYFYAETTGTLFLNAPSTWQIGDIPKEYQKPLATLIKIQ